MWVAEVKPGDYIEWTYKHNGAIVIHDEVLWSTTMNRYVPIGSMKLHLLISNADEILTWVNDEGLFHGRVDDSSADIAYASTIAVVPRVKG